VQCSLVASRASREGCTRTHCKYSGATWIVHLFRYHTPFAVVLVSLFVTIPGLQTSKCFLERFMDFESLSLAGSYETVHPRTPHHVPNAVNAVLLLQQPRLIVTAESLQACLAVRCLCYYYDYDDDYYYY
jgi:hypothetical protein